MAKIVNISLDGNDFIKKAQKGDRLAQKAIFEKYSSKMLSVCRMYIKDLQFAEDAMVKGFYKVFLHMKDFEFYGSFEGWIRKIMVNECLAYLRVQKNHFNYQEYDLVVNKLDNNYLSINNLETESIQKMIDELPEGCRLVFTLFAIEGYGHEEIAEKLEITAGTSKSQLFHARKLLKEALKKTQILENESIR